MKKLLMFLCCICVFNVTDAFAKCEILSCKDTDPWNKSVQVYDNSMDQCWFCGPGPRSCGQDDYVPQSDSYGDVIALFRCVQNGITRAGVFEQFNPGLLCKDSPVKPKGSVVNVPHAKTTFREVTSTTTTRQLRGDSYFNTGITACAYVVCEKENGYVTSKDKTGCVSNEENACDTGGGKWTGSECSCEHLGTDYAWNGKKCDKTKAAKEREANERRQQQQQASARAACVNTGGQWTNNTCICSAAKHLRDKVKGKTCDCADGYRLENKVCVITDIEKLKQACDKSGVARWNDLTQKCVCNGTEPMLTFNFDTLRCEQDPDYAACMVAKEKGIADWVNNECKCKKAGYDFINGECVESQESIDARNEADRQRRITESTAKISGLGDKLKDIMSAKLSVWKTAEGNFNGARLASDSIAGVVLGTAGGLITSTVVKKNQVKTGFEDVNCAVGGQNVAGWGDEFTVGIR